MIGLNGVSLPLGLQGTLLSKLQLPSYDFTLGDHFSQVVGLLLIAFMVVLFAKNSMSYRDHFTPNLSKAIFISVLIIYSVFQLQQVSEFLYFNF